MLNRPLKMSLKTRSITKMVRMYKWLRLMVIKIVMDKMIFQFQTS